MDILAVIPASGLGTRFLPASKVVAKEMFPILDKPTLQYIIEELHEANIKKVIITISKDKNCIKKHFKNIKKINFAIKNNKKLQEKANKHNKLVKIKFVNVNKARGVADTVYKTKKHVGNNAFILLMGDELFCGRLSATKQLLNEFKTAKTSVLGYVNVLNKQEATKYGNIQTQKVGNANYVTKFLEKPKPQNILSNKIALGKYVLLPEVFDFIKQELKTYKKQNKKEADFGEVINQMASRNKMCAVKLVGKRYDTGSLFGFVSANIDFALKDKLLKHKLENFMKDRFQNL